jgi:hypothetical protein
VGNPGSESPSTKIGITQIRQKHPDRERQLALSVSIDAGLEVKVDANRLEVMVASDQGLPIARASWCQISLRSNQHPGALSQALISQGQESE